MKKTNKIVAYLAGGFRSGWQVEVINKLVTCEVIDPSKHGLEDPAAYTKWDLDAIRKSDIVLAYMEATNPGGYSLALEVGYAKALGKTVYLVEEHQTSGRRRYFDMVRQIVDKSFDSLDDAVIAVNQLGKQRYSGE